MKSLQFVIFKDFLNNFALRFKNMFPFLVNAQAKIELRIKCQNLKFKS